MSDIDPVRSVGGRAREQLRRMTIAQRRRLAQSLIIVSYETRRDLRGLGWTKDEIYQLEQIAVASVSEAL